MIASGNSRRSVSSTSLMPISCSTRSQMAHHWIEIWWQSGPIVQSWELTDMFKKAVWVDWSFVMVLHPTNDDRQIVVVGGHGPEALLLDMVSNNAQVDCGLLIWRSACTKAQSSSSSNCSVKAQWIHVSMLLLPNSYLSIHTLEQKLLLISKCI